MIAIAMIALNLFHPGMCFNDKRNMGGKTTGELNDDYNGNGQMMAEAK
jgi:hypothetical protein